MTLPRSIVEPVILVPGLKHNVALSRVKPSLFIDISV